MVVGVPIKLLNESLHFVVTVELTSGQVYRGKLIQVEDNMNVQLRDVQMTARDGQVHNLDQVFLRGSSVRFVIVPDNFRYAPFFEGFGAAAIAGKGKAGSGLGGVVSDNRGRGNFIDCGWNRNSKIFV